MSATIRFAVVGLGHFAQVAGLPALARLRGAEIAALVSGTPEKLAALGRRYGVARRVGYEDYDALLESGDIDAVYIALPPDLHAAFTVRAAERGVHVLCEKPMAPTEQECHRMIDACAKSGVRLMIAYRLHFQAANLHVIDLIRKEEIGRPRLFSSVFSHQVKADNIRVEPRPGAGPLFDVGIYCINAARYVFRDEPISVFASRLEVPGDARFRYVEDGIAATLGFEGGRSATFQCSFGAAERSHYEVVGTAGVIECEHAYSFASPMTVSVLREGKRRRRNFRKTDQIAAEMMYFTDCIREGRDPEPSGYEGLADVRIIEALYESTRSGQVVTLEPRRRSQRPSPSQLITRPAHGEPKLVAVESDARD
jgi:predicted dehydrogenase